MEKFTQHQGLVVPLDAANVDTDQIIPKQFLQKTERIGFGKHLFHDWRYLDASGKKKQPFIYFEQATIQRSQYFTDTRKFWLWFKS